MAEHGLSKPLLIEVRPETASSHSESFLRLTFAPFQFRLTFSMSASTASGPYTPIFDSAPKFNTPLVPFHHYDHHSVQHSTRSSPNTSAGSSPRNVVVPWDQLTLGEKGNLIHAVRAETDMLRRQIAHVRTSQMDTTLSEMAANTPGVPNYHHKLKQVFKGHSGKVYQMRLTSDHQYLVSVGQDEFVIIWDAHSAQKVDAIQLSQSFATTCAVNDISTRLAVGGLSNSCSLYSLEDYDEQSQGGFKSGGRRSDRGASSRLENRIPLAILRGHSELISELIFVSSNHMATCSPDMTIRIWDAARGQQMLRYDGHLGGVNSIVNSPVNHFMLASVSADRSVKLWDTRARSSVNTFYGHAADVNLVRFFPDGNTVVSSSDDGTIRFFDLRRDCQLEARWIDPRLSVTAMEFTLSGRVLLAAFSTGECGGLDVLKGNWITSIEGHTGLISSLCVAPGGRIYTSSWDTTLRSWGPAL